jgi:ribosomal protein L29
VPDKNNNQITTRKKDWEQLKIKPAAELKKSLSEHRERLWSLKTDLAAGKVKNVNEIQKVKKLIARTLTLINQKHG